MSQLELNSGRGGFSSEETAALEGCLSLVENAVKIFAQLGNDVLRNRSARVKADILNAFGRRDEAVALINTLREDLTRLGLNPNIAQIIELPAAPSEPDLEELFGERLTRTLDDLLEKLSDPFGFLRSGFRTS